MDPSVLASFVTAILGGGGVAAFLNYRKTNAQAKDISVDTMTVVIEELRKEIAWRDKIIEQRNQEVERQYSEIAGLRERVAVLEREVVIMRKELQE